MLQQKVKNQLLVITSQKEKGGTVSAVPPAKKIKQGETRKLTVCIGKPRISS